MYLDDLCLKAKNAKYSVAKLTREEKDNALNVIAKTLVDDEESILAANAKDIEAGVANGMHQGLLDRLKLDHGRIEGMAEAERSAALPVGLFSILTLWVCKYNQ